MVYIKYLTKILKDKKLLMYCLLFGVTKFFCPLAFGFGIKYIIDTLSNSALSDDAKVVNIAYCAVVLLIVIAVGTISSYFRTFLAKILVISAQDEMRKELLDHVLNLDAKFHSDNSSGALATRITNDIQKIDAVIERGVLTMVMDFVMVITCLGILFYFNAVLTLLVFITQLATFFVLYHNSPRLRMYRRRAQRVGGDLDGRVVESLEGINTIKTFGAVGIVKANVGRMVKAFNALQVGQSVVDGKLQSLTTALQYLSQFIVISLGGGIAVLYPEWFGVGSLVLFISYTGYLDGTMRRIASNILSVQDGLAAIDRTTELLKVPLERKGGVLFSLRGQIELRDVSLSYNDGSKILRNINMTLPSGGLYAIVGKTGSGKSSLCQLLCRSRKPTEGGLYIDSKNVEDVDIDDYRRNVLITHQDSFLFEGTLEDNIRMGDYSCSESELDSAIEMASFSDVANYKNNGLCARINSRGGGISGGERQRLSLARVLLRRPKVLILDEVTSSVDVKTENEIFETLYALRGSSTVILVSHRLKFLNKADKIFVVDAGEVCEYGTYDQLFAQRGKFYNMVHEFK